MKLSKLNGGTVDLVELLRTQAKEIADEGINGWGNTMTLAADRIAELEVQYQEAFNHLRNRNARVAELEAALGNLYPRAKGDDDWIESILRERDRYRKTLEGMANDGCGLYDMDAHTCCRDRSQNQDDWCWSCIAYNSVTNPK